MSPVEVEEGDLAARRRTSTARCVSSAYFCVADVAADELRVARSSSSSNAKPSTKPARLRLLGDERARGASPRGCAPRRCAGRATRLRTKTASCCRSMSSWSAAATGPGVLVRELLGRGLVRADADELGLDADLVEQALEVDVLRLEARVADAARRRARRCGRRSRRRRGRAAPASSERAEDLLVVRAEHADGVGQLLGVRERARRLGAQDERHGVDVARPRRASRACGGARRARASPGVLLDADPHRVRRRRDARLRVARRSATVAVPGGVAAAAEAVAEERAAARAEAAPVQLEPRGADDAAPRVVGQVRDLARSRRRARRRDVDAERRRAASTGRTPCQYCELEARGRRCAARSGGSAIASV